MTPEHTMDRCPSCGEARLRAGVVAHKLSVAGRNFGGSLPGRICEACGEEVIRAEDLGLFELAAAGWLAESAPASLEAFRFMRKAVGLPVAELAGRLGVTAEMISGFEDGNLPVDPRAFDALRTIVRESLPWVAP